jgi:hypothetical protein
MRMPMPQGIPWSAYMYVWYVWYICADAWMCVCVYVCMYVCMYVCRVVSVLYIMSNSRTGMNNSSSTSNDISDPPRLRHHDAPSERKRASTLPSRCAIIPPRVQDCKHKVEFTQRRAARATQHTRASQHHRQLRCPPSGQPS